MSVLLTPLLHAYCVVKIPKAFVHHWKGEGVLSAFIQYIGKSKLYSPNDTYQVLPSSLNI